MTGGVADTVVARWGYSPPTPHKLVQRCTLFLARRQGFIYDASPPLITRNFRRRRVSAVRLPACLALRPTAMGSGSWRGVGGATGADGVSSAMVSSSARLQM